MQLDRLRFGSFLEQNRQIICQASVYQLRGAYCRGPGAAAALTLGVYRKVFLRVCIAEYEKAVSSAADVVLFHPTSFQLRFLTLQIYKNTNILQIFA